jgi:transcription-repair coupling factor (superfamily II helicase)
VRVLLGPALVWFIDRRGTLETLLAKFASPFQPGELVVHSTHGISRYVGTRMLQADDGTRTEYLQLDYAEGHRVFVPVEHIGRLSKHLGADTELARLTTEVQHRTPYSRPQKPK